MSGIHVPGSSIAGGLLGVLKAWLKARSGAIWPSAEFLPGVAGEPDAHCNGAIRVLVVDDDPVNLVLISALMEPRGLVPILAADGAEAVALACELRFDLILMDLQMPILDGLKATLAIRRFESGSSRPSIPVVAFSSTPPGAGILAKHGMSGSLAKPCGDQELEDCLVQWCPTYRAAPAMRELAHGKRCGQPASRAAGAGGASSRALR